MPKAADGYQLPLPRCYTLRVRQIRRRELQGRTNWSANVEYSGFGYIGGLPWAATKKKRVLPGVVTQPNVDG